MEPIAHKQITNNLHYSITYLIIGLYVLIKNRTYFYITIQNCVTIMSNDMRRLLSFISILFVFGLSPNWYFPGNGDTELVEYKLNGVSPGFQNESLYYSTYLNGNIYVTTSANGHVYKISAETNEIIQDYGSVGFDRYYDFKQGGPLVNDGHFIYGSIFPNPQLFYFEPTANHSNKNPFYLLDQNKLKENLITHFYDAEIFEDRNHKYVLFGAKFNNQNKRTAKFVKWNIADTKGIDDYEIITLNGLPQFVEDIETANFKVGQAIKKCVYLGISSQNNHHLEHIIIYDLISNKIISSLNLTEAKYINAFGLVRNLSADKSNPGVIWLFERTESARFPIRITRYDFNSRRYVTVKTNWIRPYEKYHFNSLQGKIITNHAVIKTDEPFNEGSIERFDPLERADLHSFNILFDGNETVYGIHNSRGLDKKYIYKVNLSCGGDITKNLIPEPDDSIKKDPSGGGVITSLLVNNNNLSGSLLNTFIEMKTSKISDRWEVNNINGSTAIPAAVQADKILMINDEKHGQVLIYGMYSGPFVRIVAKNNDELINIRDKITLPTYQVRIKDMKLTNDDQVIMATGTGDQSNDNAWLIRFDLNKYLSSEKASLQKLGETDRGFSINQIDYQFYNGKHRVVGTVLAHSAYGVFVYEIPQDWKNSKPKISVNVVPGYWPSTITFYKNKIFVAAYHGLWTFNNESINVSKDFSFKDGPIGVKYYQYLFYYESKEIKPLQFMLGNNNKMYCYSQAYLFEFDPENIGTAYPDFNSTKYIVPGYNPTTAPGLKISYITKDDGNNANHTIYVGTYVGRIFTLDH
jgi:hypothetical protein